MQQAFISPASSGTTILRLTKKQNACWDTALAAASPVDIPTGWEPRTKQQQWVAFADFPQCSVVFAAKYRRMVIYGQIKKDIGQILRKLCEQKDIEIIEAEACPDHIHMLISFSPKYSISYVMGYLKGKSSLMIFDRHANLKYKYGNRHFWAREYFVDTVGKNKQRIQEYIKRQLEQDQIADQLSLKEFTNPFTGSKGTKA
jgi:putative transposase